MRTVMVVSPIPFCFGPFVIALSLAVGRPISETPGLLCTPNHQTDSPRLSSSSLKEVPLNEPTDDCPETRATTFLAREVAQWSRTNHCFSCHNNGDAARALYTAKRLGHSILDSSLVDTTTWLSHPDRWDRNGGDGPFNNKRLARIQFSAALQSAVESGLAQNRDALVQAASLLADEQDPDGSWLSDTFAAVGSPATYGRALATLMARETLISADPKRFANAVGKADGWLRRMKIHNVMDAAVMLLASARATDSDWYKSRVEAFALLVKGQSDDGGWGPFVTAPPEPFDTALVLLALARNIDSFECRPIVKRGRDFLIANQQHDGSWPETTRPSGAESYAQRISTTGWSTLALLVTR
jgi:hypothetical protein